MKKRLPKKHCMMVITLSLQVKKNFLIRKSGIFIKDYGKSRNLSRLSKANSKPDRSSFLPKSIYRHIF